MEDHVQPDIELHVDRRLRYNPRFDENLREAVRRKVLENSDRMYEPLILGKTEWLTRRFLWVKCLLEDIESLPDAQSRWDALKSLPSALPEVYDGILRNIRYRRDLPHSMAVGNHTKRIALVIML